MVSEKAMASGMLSDMPMVSGLGPRDDPIDMDVVENVAPLCRLPANTQQGEMIRSKHFNCSLEMFSLCNKSQTNKPGIALFQGWLG